MTRIAGRLTFAFALSLAACAAAQAADPAAASYGSYGDRCGPSELVVAPYKEQICYGGEHGYAACRWVKREYSVRVPAECPRIEGVEDAYRIHRNMPGHERRGIVAKG